MTKINLIAVDPAVGSGDDLYHQQRWCYENIMVSNRKLLFQWFIFRGELLVLGRVMFILYIFIPLAPPKYFHGNPLYQTSFDKSQPEWANPKKTNPMRFHVPTPKKKANKQTHFSPQLHVHSKKQPTGIYFLYQKKSSETKSSETATIFV